MLCASLKDIPELNLSSDNSAVTYSVRRHAQNLAIDFLLHVTICLSFEGA